MEISSNIFSVVFIPMSVIKSGSSLLSDINPDFNGLTIVPKDFGFNTGKGPVPSVPSPARPNTPPASQARRSGRVFPPVDSSKAYSPSTLLPSSRTGPPTAPKPVPFSIPRTCSQCGKYHQGNCALPLANDVSLTQESLSQQTSSTEVVTASSAQQGVMFTFYRADNRAYEQLKNSSPEGFTAWVPLDVVQARKLASIFVGGKDTSGLPKHVVENITKWGGKPKLNDLSTYIKYTKDKSTVWVSTAINTEAGGQSSGAPLYEITMVLNEFKIGRTGLEPLLGGRSKNMEFSLLLDGSSIENSQVIALNHGPKDDAEVSFLTKIPMSNIKPFTGKR